MPKKIYFNQQNGQHSVIKTFIKPWKISTKSIINISNYSSTWSPASYLYVGVVWGWLNGGWKGNGGTNGINHTFKGLNFVDIDLKYWFVRITSFLGNFMYVSPLHTWESLTFVYFF